MNKPVNLTLKLLLAFLLAACSALRSPPPPATPTVAPAAAVQNSADAPRFSHPTEINNPFFPVSLTAQAIYLGKEGGKSARNEVTLLPGTERIFWNGQETDALVVQFMALTGGRLVEVAYDYFAQADDGSVYYLGEDVSNYETGKVNHEGSWRAGKDSATPSLIMPAHPAVGDKFYPENIPGVAFESAEIMSLAEKAATPAGAIDNGILVKEGLMDGSIEIKVYAANFGIVVDQSTDDELKLVLLNRTDAKPGSVPEALTTIESQAEDIIDVVPGGQWENVRTDIAAISDAWQAYQAQAASDHTPQPFLEAFTTELGRLQKASSASDITGVLQAANDLSAAVNDLNSVYRPATPPDLGRLDVQERQVIQDVAANGLSAAANSLAKTTAIWARLKPVILAHNGADTAALFENSLTAQQADLEKGSASSLENEAIKSLDLVDALERLF